MSLADDLLEQAEMLVKREPKHPKQASLRRAVSSAYYALFHLLVEETARLFVQNDPEMTARIQRTLGHIEMKRASGAILKDELPESIRNERGGYNFPSQLKEVAKAFVRLQEFRHKADYDLAEQFHRSQVQELIREVRTAFTRWKEVRDTDHARLYLACFLVWDVWKKPAR